jgi:hypothetical protein
MIPENILDEISQKLASSPHPYHIHMGQNWESVETDGLYWELLPLAEEEKTVEMRYHDLLVKASQLASVDIHDPNLKSLELQIKQLLPNIKLFKINGLEIYTKTNLRSLEKNKGIRKEWFEIRSKYKDCGISFYLGFMRENFFEEKGVDFIIAMPSSDQYDFLRLCHTGAYTLRHSTEKIITLLEKLNQEYGLSVLFASETTLDFVLEKPIERDNFSKIRARVMRMCRDTEDLSGQLHLGVVHLWWD